MQGLLNDVRLVVEILPASRSLQGVPKLPLGDLTHVLETRWILTKVDPLAPPLKLDVVGHREPPESGPRVIRRWYIDAQTVASGDAMRMRTTDRVANTDNRRRSPDDTSPVAAAGTRLCFEGMRSDVVSCCVI